MSDSSWVLKGVEPEVREKAVAEAARLGVSVADYLTDMLLRSALLDQVSGASEGEPAPLSLADVTNFAPLPESPEAFAVRHRLKGLERRLSATAGSLDGAIQAVDTSLFDLTARVGDVEGLAGDTAHALGQTQQDVGNTVTGLQLHLAVLEDNLAGLGRAQDERAGGLSHRIDYVEALAHGAQQSVVVVADAHEALKYAVAEDFAAFANETTDRLADGLRDVRTAADLAAQQADAAVAHLIVELRSVREVLEERLDESVAETRAQIRAVFADNAEKIAGLTRITEQLRGQLVDVEDGAQIAIEETAQKLRQADAALAADIAVAAHDTLAAVEHARRTLTDEIVAVREDQFSQLARLKLVDVAVGNTINEIGTIREAVEARLQSALAEAEANASARDEALDTRATAMEREATHLRQTLIVEIERVETSTLVSLQKLARDIADGDSGADNRLDLVAQNFRADLHQLRQQAEIGLATLREEHSGAVARITLLDNALARVETAQGPVDQRLSRLEDALDTGFSARFEQIEASLDAGLSARVAQLEAAAENAETAQALAIVRAQVEALAARLEDNSGETALNARLTGLQDRLAAYDAASDTFGEQLEGLARMLNRVATQSVETAQKAEERAHQVELAVADLRLNQLSASESTTAADAANGVLALEARFTAMEQRQNEALHALRNDIARFVGDNDRRLEALERAPAAAAPDTDELLARFEDLRQRIEDRVHGVEVRSVRTLEQVIDTVATMEQRLFQAGEDAEAKTA